ncbi:hypothetical protein GEMRC1_012753 [Eukaryota sp. GEM-RC1]
MPPSSSIITDSIELSLSSVLNTTSPFSDLISSEPSVVQSDADEELLVHMHFQSPLRLDGFTIRVPDEEDDGVSRAPGKIFFFKNAPQLSFSDCHDSKPDHQVNLEDSDYVADSSIPGVRSVTIPFKAFKWNGTSSVTIFVSNNIERDETTVVYQIVPLGLPSQSRGGLEMGRLQEIKDQAKKGG